MPLFGNLFRGTPPGDLGLRDGRLRPPPSTPNCAHSQVEPANQAHVDPLPGDWDAVVKAIEAHPEATVVARTDDWVHAEARTPTMGFVDDLELQRTDEGIVHVRSASRLGSGDLDKNRQRVDEIRTILDDAPR